MASKNITIIDAPKDMKSHSLAADSRFVPLPNEMRIAKGRESLLAGSQIAQPLYLSGVQSKIEFFGLLSGDTPFEGISDLTGGCLTKIVNYYLYHDIIYRIHFRHVHIFDVDIGLQLPFRAFARVAEHETGRGPKTDSRCGQYKCENSNAKGEEDSGIVPCLHPKLPDGFIRFVFIVGGTAFLLVLSGMMALRWWVQH